MNNKEPIFIVGISTNARHVFHFINNYDLFEIKGFVVDRDYIIENSFMGKPVVSMDELDRYMDFDKDYIFISLLWNRLNSDRRKLYERLKSTYSKLRFANIISPKATIRGNIRGDNVWVHDNVIIQNDSVIGNDVAIMAMSLIGSGVIIQDHCFLGAKSTVGGGSKIGEQSFVGINCTVFDDTVVGKKCILGACTAVKRNVPDFSMYKTASGISYSQFDEAVIESKLEYKKNVR